MKKITMLIIALLGAAVAHAQFEKGTMLIGGSLGADFQTEKTKFDGNSITTGKYSEFSLAPQFAYFVIDNLAVGGAIGLSLYSYKDDNSDYKYVSNEITIEPAVRYYLPQNVFFQARFIIGTNTDKDVEGSVTDKDTYTVSGFALSAGYAYFFTDNIAVEPMLGFDSKGYKNNSTERKFVDAGLFIRVGFQIYFKKK